MFDEKEYIISAVQFKKLFEKKCKKIMEEYGLRQIELEILLFLQSQNSYDTARDFSNWNHISKAHVSKSIENLKKYDYIYQEEDVSDHRLYHLKITDKAIPVLDNYKQITQQCKKILLKDVTEDELHVLMNVMGKMAKNLTEENERV